MKFLNWKGPNNISLVFFIEVSNDHKPLKEYLILVVFFGVFL